jgi:pimeloyl-ACP methyl ester carboxylesterase
MNRQTDYSRLLGIIALACLMLPSLVSCSYLSIPEKDDVASKTINPKGDNNAPVYNSAVIKGRITGADKGNVSTLIIAHRPAGVSGELAEYLAVNNSGAFMLYLPQGRYQLYTIADHNHNGIYENDEISGVYGSFFSPKEISIRENELITDVVIRTARPNSNQTNFSLESALKKKQDVVKQITHNGQVLKIYHEYFSPENAQTGYWHPSSFMKVFGAHIYLAGEYNPRKIPILFIHGTEGSPQNWIYLYMRLDQSRYQPWFFYYPSGIRLSLAAALLNEELRELQEKYGFQKMGIVAHSVGGLTTRSFLTRFASDNQNNFIKLFVTFATPWSGFGIADASQILIHKSIPVWVDLGTQSPFIKTTLEDRLPPNVRHYIFYGKNDKHCGSKATDDRAIICAVETFAFNCDHTSILSDRKVFLKFNEILEKELW